MIGWGQTPPPTTAPGPDELLVAVQSTQGAVMALVLLGVVVTFLALWALLRAGGA